MTQLFSRGSQLKSIGEFLLKNIPHDFGQIHVDQETQIFWQRNQFSRSNYVVYWHIVCFTRINRSNYFRQTKNVFAHASRIPLSFVSSSRINGLNIGQFYTVINIQSSHLKREKSLSFWRWHDENRKKKVTHAGLCISIEIKYEIDSLAIDWSRPRYSLSIMWIADSMISVDEYDRTVRYNTRISCQNKISTPRFLYDFRVQTLTGNFVETKLNQQ